MDVFIPMARGSYVKAGLCSKDIFKERGTEILLYGRGFKLLSPQTPPIWDFVSSIGDKHFLLLNVLGFA